MKTFAPSRLRSQLQGNPLSLCFMLLTVAWAAGCGEPTPSSVPAGHEGSMTRMLCSTGDCTNPTNGRGIFVSEGSSYCIPIPNTEGSIFCPEHFTNLADGGVVVTGQRVYPARGFPETPVDVSFQLSGRFMEKPIQVTRFIIDSTQLTVAALDENSQELNLSDSALLDLVFEIDNGVQLRIIPSAPESGIMLYRAEYYVSSSASWQPYCEDGQGEVAFLPDATVHSVTANVTDSSQEVTVACRSGAIATCMVWGYRPWEATAGTAHVQADTLYGSCLQAKRAAYFASEGDFNSYTVTGTPLSIQDQEGIMDLAMPGVEAVWTPKGASCFTPALRRIPPPGAGPMPTLPAVINLPVCDPDLNWPAAAGGLPAILPDSTPLATGRPLL